MVSRRSVLSGSALGGIVASLAPEAEAAPAGAQQTQRVSDEGMANGLAQVVTALTQLREEIRRQDTFWELNSLRDPIRMYLRTAGKYPDFIEVGTDTWQQVYDWHVRYQQTPTIGRNPEGRYTIMLMATMLIQRVDVQPNYVGIPFDNR